MSCAEVAASEAFGDRVLKFLLDTGLYDLDFLLLQVLDLDLDLDLEQCFELEVDREYLLYREYLNLLLEWDRERRLDLYFENMLLDLDRRYFVLLLARFLDVERSLDCFFLVNLSLRECDSLSVSLSFFGCFCRFMLFAITRF